MSFLRTVKPFPCSILTVQEPESTIESIDKEYNNDHNISSISNSTNDVDLGVSYNPNFMEMDGTYDCNIKIPMNFSYWTVPKSIHNIYIYNECSPPFRDNAPNRFKGPFEACAVAGGLNRELILHLMLHTNEYAHSKSFDYGDFCRYKCSNISIAEMYLFLGIILKMSSYLYDTVPSSQFVNRDCPSWTKQYMSSSRFVQIHATLHPERRTSTE